MVTETPENGGTAQPNEPLVFYMGKYAAAIPLNRHYCKNHMWCLPITDGTYRFGFSAYAIRLMKDIYFLDWCVDADSHVAYKQQIGNIETSKAVSDLFSPAEGKILEFNQEILRDPALINVDGDNQGWLFSMTATNIERMSPQEYFNFLTANWENTQRILKGQMGD